MSASNSDSESDRSLKSWTLLNESQKSDSDSGSSAFVELNTTAPDTVVYARKNKSQQQEDSADSDLDNLYRDEDEDVVDTVDNLQLSATPVVKEPLLPHEDGAIFEEDSDGYNYDFAYPDRFGENPDELSDDPDITYTQMLRQEVAEEGDSDDSHEINEPQLNRSRSSFEELDGDVQDGNITPEVLQPSNVAPTQAEGASNEESSSDDGAVAGPSGTGRPPLVLDRAACERLRPENSESDHSDFVKLEYVAEDNDADDEDPVAMQISTGSSRGSSISSGFRFFRPLKLPVGTNYRMIYKDDDMESLPDVMEDEVSDDGNAGDDEDLSNMTYNINDLQLSAENVPRSYRHNPNQWLNTVLTVFAAVSVCLAIGVGLGHYMGTQKEANLYKQRLTKMKELQDDYLLCLRQQDILESQIQSSPYSDQKVAKVASIWRKKYEELILEKVELEQQISNMAQELAQENKEQDLIQSQADAYNTQLSDIQNKLKELTQENSVLSIENEQLLQREQVIQKELEKLNEVVEEKNQELKAVDPVDAQARKEKLAALETAKKDLKSLDVEMNNLVKELNEVKNLHQTCLRAKQDAEESLVKMRYTVHPTNSDIDLPAVIVPIIEQDSTEENVIVMNEVKASSAEVASDEEADTPEVSTLRDTIEQLEHDLQVARNERELLVTLLEEENTTKISDTTLSDKSIETPGVETMQQEEAGNVDVTNRADDTDDENKSEESEKDDLFNDDDTVNEKPDAASVLDKFVVLLKETGIMNMTDAVTGQVKDALDEQWKFVSSLASDPTVKSHLNEAWRVYNVTVATGINYTDQARNTLNVAKRDIQEKWNEFVNSERVESIYNSTSETISDITKQDRIHKVVNATKATISVLSDKVHETMDKVMNLSEDFIATNPVTKSVKEGVETVASKINGETYRRAEESVKSGYKKAEESVKSGYKQAEESVKSGWKKVKDYVKQNSWFSRKKDTQKHSDENKSRHHKQSHSHNSGSYEDDIPFDDTFVNEIPKRKFDSKPNHKQKQSSNVEEYMLFWENTGFNPELYLQEGFFEGNEQDLKKMVKRMKKLHSKISGLSEDHFLDMDEDDIEDLYDDLDDLEDDIEETGHQPVTEQQTWLTCQVLWWKSRFQRKKRSEFLVQECGHQLMTWQLKMLCEPCDFVSKKCEKDTRKIAKSCDAHKASVIKTDEGKYGPLNKNKPNKKQNCKHKHAGHKQKKYSNKKNKVYRVSGKYQPIPDRDQYTKPRTPKVTDKSMPTPVLEINDTDGTWYFRDSTHPRETESQDDGHDAKWLFNRALELENKLHSTDWVFERADEREFEREKPWYFRRVDQREEHHQKVGTPSKHDQRYIKNPHKFEHHREPKNHHKFEHHHKFDNHRFRRPSREWRCDDL